MHNPIFLSLHQSLILLCAFYLHALFNLLSTDTAIINYGKEKEKKKTHTAGQGSQGCGEKGFLPSQSEHRVEQRFHTGPRTPRSKEQLWQTGFLRLSSLIFSTPANQPGPELDSLAEGLLLCQGCQVKSNPEPEPLAF